MLLPQSPEERIERIEANLRRFKVPKLKNPLPERPERLFVVGFGPSLVDTWKDIRDGVVLTTSGAHDFLISKGIIPTYHVESDSREHKVFFLRNPHPDTTYYLGSQCHPKMFARLRHNKVVMWHGYVNGSIDEHLAVANRYDPGSVLLSGGTNAGLRAVIVGRHLGFKQFVLHGIDCSYRGDVQWAGKHSGATHHAVQVRCNDKVFNTSDIMMRATDDFFTQMFTPGLRDCSFLVAGDGLLAERLNIFRHDPEVALSPKWWAPHNFHLRLKEVA